MAIRLVFGLITSLMLTFAGAAAFGESMQPAPLKVIATVYAYAHPHSAHCTTPSNVARTAS